MKPFLVDERVARDSAADGERDEHAFAAAREAAHEEDADGDETDADGCHRRDMAAEHDGRPEQDKQRSRPTSDRIYDGQLASAVGDRKSTRLNSSHPSISYAVFCLK